MTEEMSHAVLTQILLGGASLLFAACIGMFAYAIMQNVEGRIAQGGRVERAGFAGASSAFLRRVGDMSRPLMWPSYENRQTKQLIRAGEPHAFRPEDMLALQELSFLGSLLLGIFCAYVLDAGFGWAIVLAVLGAAYPLIWLNDQVKKRHLLISRALPYSIDLLTLSVEAGLDFTAALAKVVEKGKPGPFKDEMSLTLKHLKMGKTREEALKGLMARVDLPSLTNFISSLIQADRMGTSLGKILRIQSTQMRNDRTQRAEKLANEAPVKMLFPLIVCIFPTVFLILFGPIVFAFMFGGVGA